MPIFYTENENTVITIRRMAMRGGDDKFVIEFGGKKLVIQPGRADQYKLIQLLAGGAIESVQLAAEQR